MARKQEQYDIAVIGGGPAGMMAAIAASSANVVLIDKNPTLGRKLLVTGGGRCNITQAEFNNRKLAEKYGPTGKFLLSPLAIYGPKQIIDLLEINGVKTKIERGNRVFPVSNKSTDVLKILQRKLRKVKILTNEKVINFDGEKIVLKHKEITAKAFILATGGKTFPGTGSTGDGYQWAKNIGHTIIEPRPALSAIELEEEWIKELQGLSLKNIQIDVFQNNKKKDCLFGEMIFTHFGVSGPVILNLSKKIDKLLNNGPVKIKLDLKPAIDINTLDQRLQKDFQGNKVYKNYLAELLPAKMINPTIVNTNIPADKKINTITKDERKRLLTFLKAIPLTVKKLSGFNHAIVTTGGVALNEIDSRTMQSKIKPNLFLAGEIIDLDGPTGGYNLQLSWTTGYVAGQSAINLIK